MKAILRADGALELRGSFAEMLPIRNQLESVGCRVERIEVEPVRVQPLTQRQHDILTWICNRLDANGYPPTFREIGDAFSIRSTNGVNDHLKSLERKGWVKRTELASRGLKILRRP